MSISLKIFQKNVFNQGLKPFLAYVRNLTTNISKYGLQSCEKLSGHEYKHLKQADPLGSAMYGFTGLQSLRIEILAGVPDQIDITITIQHQVHQRGL